MEIVMHSASSVHDLKLRQSLSVYLIYSSSASTALDLTRLTYRTDYI